MKHIKDFNQYSINEEEGKFAKFFRGHESDDERDTKMMNFHKELDSYEQKAKEDSDIVFNRQFLEKQAKENNYKGHLEERRSAGTEKTHIFYVVGKSEFQKIASLAANKRDNPLN
jgi:hypothetical protein